MKRLFVAGAALLALASSAVAADLPAPQPYYKAPAYLPPPAVERLLSRCERRRRVRQLDVGYRGKHQHLGRAGRRHHRLQLPDQPLCHRRRRRHRLGQHLRLDHDAGLPRRLQDQQFLAIDGTRAGRLCGRPVPALHHRRRRVRQHPSHDRGSDDDHDQRRLDRRCRPRICHHRPTGPPRPNISTSISASSIAD